MSNVIRFSKHLLTASFMDLRSLVGATSPASADVGTYEACGSFAGPVNGTGWNVCVNVVGNNRHGFVNFVNYTSSNISVSVSSVYLLQCSGTGSGCIQIAANSGSGTAYPST